MTARPENGEKLRQPFLLRRLLIVTTLFSASLGIGRWWWLGYQKALVVVPLTAKDDLSLYVGRRVKFSGYANRNQGVVYLGDQVIVCGFPLFAGNAFDKSKAQLEEIEGVLVIYDGYAKDVPERKPAKYALENSGSGLSFIATNIVIAFFTVDPLLTWLLRRLRKHRSWYLGLWLPVSALLVFGLGYGIFFLKTHDFQTFGYGFMTYQPGRLVVFSAITFFGYLGIAFLCALPEWQWRKPKGALVFCLTTAICFAAGVLLRAWYLAIR